MPSPLSTFKTQEIRFTPEGIPYVVEFSNVSVRPPIPPPKPTTQARPKPPAPTRSRTAPPAMRLPTVQEEPASEGGLFIHFPHASSSRRPGRTQLLRLRNVITEAVLAAGMDSPPAVQCADPLHHAGMRHSMRAGAAAMAAAGREAAKVARGSAGEGALFRGTYGQVVAALKAAGLAITPCGEAGVREATKLGALFVAKHRAGGVEFRKLTLWG